MHSQTLDCLCKVRQNLPDFASIWTGPHSPFHFLQQMPQSGLNSSPVFPEGKHSPHFPSHPHTSLCQYTVWIIILSHTPSAHPAHLLPIYLVTIKAIRNIIFLPSKPYRKFSALFVQMMPMENVPVMSVSVLSDSLQHSFLGSLCQYAKLNND